MNLLWVSAVATGHKVAVIKLSENSSDQEQKTEKDVPVTCKVHFHWSKWTLWVWFVTKRAKQDALPFLQVGCLLPIVGPWQVWYMGSACMRVASGFVPWVVVSNKGNVWRIVEFLCKPQSILIREVQPRVELFVQLTGNWRAPRFALWPWWWWWFWCWHCCLVSVARLHSRCVWFALCRKLDCQLFLAFARVILIVRRWILS